MLRKKNLEIQVIRDNKKQEILQQILCEEPSWHKQRAVMREKAKKLIQEGK